MFEIRTEKSDNVLNPLLKIEAGAITIRVQPMRLCSLIISYQQYGEPPRQTSVPQRTPRHRRSKLHSIRFSPTGKSSFIPLLLLSQSDPLRWAPIGFEGADDRARMPPAGTAFGMAVSVDPVWVHYETPLHGLRTRPVGLPRG